MNLNEAAANAEKTRLAYNAMARKMNGTAGTDTSDFSRLAKEMATARNVYSKLLTAASLTSELKVGDFVETRSGHLGVITSIARTKCNVQYVDSIHKKAQYAFGYKVSARTVTGCTSKIGTLTKVELTDEQKVLVLTSNNSDVRGAV